MSLSIIISENETWEISIPIFVQMSDAIYEQLNKRDPFEQKLATILDEATIFIEFDDFTVEEFNHLCRIYKKAMEKYPDSKNGLRSKKNGHFEEIWGGFEAFPKRLKLDPRYRDSL